MQDGDWEKGHCYFHSLVLRSLYSNYLRYIIQWLVVEIMSHILKKSVPILADASTETLRDYHALVYDWFNESCAHLLISSPSIQGYISLGVSC